MAFITIQTTINAPIASVCEKWTSPEHVQHWNFASPDWHCPSAKTDLQQAGWQMILDNFKSYAESATS